jgi:DNA-binding NarL/FixJ family response regulator
MRIILADDSSAVRSAIKLLLSEKEKLDLVGEAEDAGPLFDQLKSLQPDLVSLDWELANNKKEPVLKTLRDDFSDMAVIVLSSYPQNKTPALKAGATAFVCKSDPPETLIRAIEKIK